MINPAVFAAVYQRNTRLLIYNDLLSDPVVAAFLEVCRLLGNMKPDQQQPNTVQELDTACRRFFHLLAGATELSQEPLSGDPWQSYLLDHLLAAENTFTLKAEQRGAGSMGAALQAAARQDLTDLQALAGLAAPAYAAARDVLTSNIALASDPGQRDSQPAMAGGAGASGEKSLSLALLSQDTTASGSTMPEARNTIENSSAAGNLPAMENLPYANVRLPGAILATATIPDWTQLQPLDPVCTAFSAPPHDPAPFAPAPVRESKAAGGAFRGPSPSTLQPPAVARRELKKQLLATADWGREGLNLLADYYHAYGAGILGSFWAFRWERGPAGGRLAGIADPDPITFANLIGYEAERQEVVRNTEKFLRGLPAVNILLYGARGTGKSSTVKALLPACGSRGLRLVELPKRLLSDYQEILKILAPRPQKFIIFIDDLSFEEDEVEYKELKGLLEGSLQVRPANVLVYATSNRRHLVKESFADRSFNPAVTAGGDVRLQDTVQEKLSLAERFGLTVIFPSPDQEQYLTIVHELARQAGLELEPGELRRRALQWALYQNGASGRTARQFMDYLCGEHA